METELKKAHKQLQLKRIEFTKELKQVGKNTEMSEEDKVEYIKPIRDKIQAARKLVTELEMAKK